MAILRIKVKTPRPSDHEKFIEQKLKNPAIEKIRASFDSSTGTIECTYDEKKYSSKTRLEREIRTTLDKHGYKFGY